MFISNRNDNVIKLEMTFKIVFNADDRFQI